MSYLIIPDVHGRTFWKEPVIETLKNTNGKIIFLGDYLDCYPYEWDDSIDYQQMAIDNFKEIIEIKKNNPERVVLLIGNHDCTYCVGTFVCDCRADKKNFDTISKLFKENETLFQLAFDDIVNNKHYIFSHAGINKTYANYCFNNDVNEYNVVTMFNNCWSDKNYGILDSLSLYDKYRGWLGLEYASLVWADVREWDNGQELMGEYSVFGHTQLQSKPIIRENYACLDCRKAFILDENGITEYKKAED